MGKWTVKEDKGYEDTREILFFLLEKFEAIFGKDVMHHERCEVYNDPDAPCPRFIYSSPLRIRLHLSRTSLWSKTIFQLAHEMCHYAMYQVKKDKKVTLSWFEEIVCEAMALYALEYASEKWNNCNLSRFSPKFAVYHREYLEDVLSDSFTNEFKLCSSVDKLRRYELDGKPENKRQTHGAEVSILYRAISAEPGALKYVLDYTKYINKDGITIDFDRWLKNSSCNLLRLLQWIQPVSGI
ncbi:MAG: hypothetical protein E7617_06205 [Ruminococcaceae bacterium]|nr:hypothetical protein [Oscillospiraceae bacterium]